MADISTRKTIEIFRFIGEAKKTKDGVGVWTDGIGVYSDNEDFCAYRLKAGRKYSIRIERVKK